MISPNDIRLVLTDVDGTLVTNDKVLTPDAVAAAHALHEAGVALTVVSSRPPYGMGMLVEPLGLQQPMAGCNGGALVNPDLSIIETRLIDLETAKRTVAFLAGCGLDVWLYTETQWFVPSAKGAHVERESWILKFDPVVATSFSDGDLAHAVKIVGVSDDYPKVAESEARAKAVLGDRVSAARSAAHFLDVTDPLANKGAVVETMARRLNISTGQIATIGDMPNDVLMFRKCGFSIAMGNASDAVKAQASAVTRSNQDDGFAEAVRQFILPMVAP